MDQISDQNFFRTVSINKTLYINSITNDFLTPLIEDLKNIMKNGIVKEYIDDTDQRKKDGV